MSDAPEDEPPPRPDPPRPTFAPPDPGQPPAPRPYPPGHYAPQGGSHPYPPQGPYPPPRGPGPHPPQGAGPHPPGAYPPQTGGPHTPQAAYPPQNAEPHSPQGAFPSQGAGPHSPRGAFPSQGAGPQYPQGAYPAQGAGPYPSGAYPPQGAGQYPPQGGPRPYSPPGGPGPYPPQVGHPYPPASYSAPPRPIHFSEGTHRLHWATAPLRAFVVLVIYFVLLGLPLLFAAVTGDDTAQALTLFAITGAAALVTAAGAGLWGWRAVRFRVEGDDLVVVTGLVRARTRSIPLSRVQAIDLVRPLMTRVFGLTEVRVEVAGGERSEILLRYLGRNPAQQLRAELLARAAGLPGQTPEAPETPFWRLGFGTLLGSLLMRVPVIATFLLFLGSLMFLLVFAELAMLAVAVPALLAMIRTVVVPVVMYGGFTVALSPDGVRLRYGVLETRMQTVPPGRVQAVALVEPLAWRPLSLARLEVTVAGYAGERQALSSVLLPVAPRAVCVRLIGEIFPGTVLDAIPLVPPSPKSVAADRPEGAGTDDTVFVARRGFPSRRTDVIAHARAQSVRMTVNPLQRMLGVATVHIDAPPGPVRVKAAGRDLGEARAIVESVAQRALAARRTGGDTARWAR
ncbi:PH domain-containing protein [Actinomadura flavalba]|uniref:PH domain-containing protein n=1 Tax=Actinomadura flavalba TaxID=1120938 RepID=UPI001F0A99B6|nr:PH domain-containing protein [Actinomadura flavalba]